MKNYYKSIKNSKSSFGYKVARSWNITGARYKCITIMQRYTKTKVIRISDMQLKTLQKMKSYNIDVGKFIREAIAQKIKREYSNLIPKPEKIKCPF